MFDVPVRAVSSQILNEAHTADSKNGSDWKLHSTELENKLVFSEETPSAHFALCQQEVPTNQYQKLFLMLVDGASCKEHLCQKINKENHYKIKVFDFFPASYARRPCIPKTSPTNIDRLKKSVRVISSTNWAHTCILHQKSDGFWKPVWLIFLFKQTACAKENEGKRFYIDA